MVMPATKTVNAINRGAELLKILSEGHSRLEYIYPLIGLSKSTTHRFLKSLVSSGLAYQNPINRQYYLGPLFLKLSSNPFVSHQMLILSSMDELRKLRDSTDETSMITIPNGDQRLVLKEVSSKQKIALSLGDGNGAPIYVGSAGRTILAQYTDEELKKILGIIRVAPAGLSPIKDENLLRREIHAIRKKGFGTSLGENHPDAVGISVPVKGYIFPVSLCVMGLERRFEPTSILDELKESAIRISENLLQGV